MDKNRSTATSIPTNEPVGVIVDETEQKHGDRYKWTALSVTTVGALLASIQGSALLIALPNILNELHATFFTIMWVLLGYLLIRPDELGLTE